MYQINEDAYYILRQLKNKVAFIRGITDAGIESKPHSIVTTDQISTIFNEMEQQLEEILKGVELTSQRTLRESSE